ncbi:MAG TPA: aminotransferase class IV [Deltaproteobacteria bacterium]|nr:aminotransferase class IV [Deltaproteobacteria bacterium]
MASGTHTTQTDPRNASVLVYLNGVLVPRDEARVSVLDAGFLLGDGVWESFRIHRGQPVFLDDHLDRLAEGLAALDLDPGLDRAELAEAIERTLTANDMTDGVHVRLMITRGLKATPFQGRSADAGSATVVILAEHKAPAPELRTRCLRLATVHVRRGRPDVQDPGWNSHSKLNCVSAAIQAEKLGVDEALMLDPHGFVATCNSTHFFLVRRGELWTSTPRYILEGITRGKVLQLAQQHGLVAHQADFTLRKVYSADEAFCTGTFGGLMPVGEVDGRTIGTGHPGPLTERLQGLYDAAIESDVARRLAAR